MVLVLESPADTPPPSTWPPSLLSLEVVTCSVGGEEEVDMLYRYVYARERERERGREGGRGVTKELLLVIFRELTAVKDDITPTSA